VKDKLNGAKKREAETKIRTKTKIKESFDQRAKIKDINTLTTYL